jgi:hypothetical protein
MSKKYLYIRANPKDVTQNEYNAFARQYPRPSVWIIDWVSDCTGWNQTEITPDEYNRIHVQKTYGKNPL